MKQKCKIEQGSEARLRYLQTEFGIRLVKDYFEGKLAKKLSLCRITSPKFLEVETGLQDDLAGTQEPVSFEIKSAGKKVEIIHSLAKWKRFILGKFGFEIGTGIYTDMDAIRKDEDLSEIHSAYVDQWDWERVISKEDRSLDFLKQIVEKIYEAILETEEIVIEKFGLKSRLSKEIKFVHTEELEEMYPDLTSKQREDAITKKFGSVFLIGIGYPLKSGEPHDVRAADYDDWITVTEKGRGLDGDILVWDDIRQKSLELSSMGIRVDAESLKEQLKFAGLEDRKDLEFHKGIIEGKLPLSIGGGIGQSRLCMFLLQKSHIGEVQSSVWPEKMKTKCKEVEVSLL